MTAQTPRALGYRMPAEWEPHEATWIAWPHNPEDWPGKFEPISWVYADIVRCLSSVERVEILVNDAAAEESAWKTLDLTGVAPDHVRFHRWPTDRVWTRDSGPIFVRRQDTGAIAAIQWQFNAWAKYENWQHDAEFPARATSLLGIPAWQPRVRGQRVVLEGGSIDTNGQGVLLTTEECLLSEVQQRNPGLTRDDLDTCLQEYLGIDKVIWLDRGIVGDDTHGHVDDISRFVAADTILTAIEPDPSDENHEILAENIARLQSATDQAGKPFRIVTLPMPDPVVFDGQRLPASYANFYIANQLVLIPTFSDAKDRIALETIASLFPSRKIVGIPCRDFIWGLGALHCMTQQQPASIVP